MNTRENELLKNRLTLLQGQLSSQLRLKKSERTNVQGLQQRINTIKRWMR